MAVTVPARAELRGGVLAPLLRPGVYRIVWTANLVSSLGTLIQGVGAAWLMTSLAGTPDMVALVQTATQAPVLIFALVAGAVADILDRRRVLIIAQLWMALVSIWLAVLRMLGHLDPAGLLLLTFALGIGTALNGPAWQTAVREIVGADELAAAVTLNAIAFNIARAIGPALGGVLIAALGPEAAFIANAVSSLALIGAILIWRREQARDDLPRERLGTAMVTGLRYVQETATIRAALVRATVFSTLAVAVMALLPLVARDRLHGDASLYGLLLGSFGLGALGGAFAIHPVRQAKGAEFVITLLSVAFGLALILIGAVPSLATVPLALAVGGAAWLSSFATFNISIQFATAPWVQARVLALYQALTAGGMALGSWLWGQLAGVVGLDVAQVVVGVLMLASILLRYRFPMPAGEAPDLRPMADRRDDPKPVVLFSYEEGPVLVMIEYRVPEASADAFMRAMEDVGHMRKRDGAWRWNLFQDTEDAQHWFETFTLKSWFEYLRQRRRGTAADEAILARGRSYLDPAFAPVVRRLIVRTPDRWLRARQRAGQAPRA